MKVKELKEILKSCNDDDNLNLYINEDEKSKVLAVLHTVGKHRPQDLYKQEFKRGTITCCVCNKQFIVHPSIDRKITYCCPYCGAKN